MNYYLVQALIYVIFSVTFSTSVIAQAPQFAVVKPNGSTTIHSSWATAYDAAIDGDFIYLPGVGISETVTIDKRLHIFGAGHHPDSSSATGRTIIGAGVQIHNGATNGSLQGVAINGTLSLGNDGQKLTSFLVSRCSILSFTSLGGAQPHPDSLPEFITFSENVFNGYIQTGGSVQARNILFDKNIISNTVAYFTSSTFNNNIFLLNANIFFNTTQSTFQNNIFNSPGPINPSSNNCFNTFLNNIKLILPIFEESGSCPVMAQSGNLSADSIDDILASYTPGAPYYDNDFHLNPTCPCVGAGTDGTDLGIYGTNSPTPEGWVPSNPHIYFKDIAPTTGPDGKLHIEIGVRTNN